MILYELYDYKLEKSYHICDSATVEGDHSNRSSMLSGIGIGTKFEVERPRCAARNAAKIIGEFFQSLHL